MTEYPGLTFRAEENRLMASLGPRSEPPLLDADAVRRMLEQSRYATWYIMDEALAILVARYNSSTDQLDLPLGELRDASFVLDIDADAMQASVTVTPANGGKALEIDDIYLKLGEAGVTFGIDREAVSAACSGPAGERFRVAVGVPTENGQDARFELLTTDARDRAPHVDEHGLIDFRDLGAIPTVHADQPLMRRIPATPGVPGRTVRGEVLEPSPGRNEGFAERLVGAYIAPDDPNLLRAVFSGQPVRCGNAVNVEPVFHVRNVNVATGNVSFDGTINIEGEVLPGMKVQATGDIIVGGVIDGAELDAGGDIRISGGIIAKARVRAGGSVSARFVENAQVLSGTTIAIDDTALQSDLQANNQIIVGLKSPQRGRLAGGSARAMMLIQAPILGSSTGGVTRLLLGVNPVLEAQYRDLLSRIEKQKADEDNLDKLVKHLSKQGEKAAGMLERAKASWQEAVKGWAKLLPERDDLERQLALIAGARVDVSVGVAGAVDLTFASKVQHLRKTYEAGSFSVSGDHVVFANPQGKLLPVG
jgi:uncharacterized protein